MTPAGMARMTQKRRPAWSTGKELAASFGYRTGMSGDRMTILSSVWQRELGHLSRYWELTGIKQGTLFVKPRSAAAVQELHMRGAGIVRSLNKYFSRAWITCIKVSSR